MTTQISAISAAQHYAASAAFWEQRAKVLQHQLDEANAKMAEQPPPEPAPTKK